MFVDLDWPLNASSLLSASAELLVEMTDGTRFDGLWFLLAIHSNYEPNFMLLIHVDMPRYRAKFAFFVSHLHLTFHVHTENFVALFRFKNCNDGVGCCVSVSQRRLICAAVETQNQRATNRRIDLTAAHKKADCCRAYCSKATWRRTLHISVKRQTLQPAIGWLITHDIRGVRTQGRAGEGHGGLPHALAAW